MKQKDKKANSIDNNLCRRVCELKMADIKKKDTVWLVCVFKKERKQELNVMIISVKLYIHME